MLPGRFLTVCSPRPHPRLAAEQYNLETYFPTGKQGSTSFDPNELSYIDASAGNYPNKW